MSTVYTIGFTRKPAATFFGLLKRAGVRMVIDTRVNNLSQLAGFSKREDLRYFLEAICNIDYVESKDLAPEKNILKRYQQKELTWEAYAAEYTNGLVRKNAERLVDQAIVDQGCLLCSEHLPHHCHRRLAAEYLQAHWGKTFEIRHLIDLE
ncbi:DUF488 domain-containing protein [Thiobacillus sp.]|jgi:uncharacterized protein (DUF488 family)|uniref:DUF488 domain-containing protein n=1 Tax=Thiobacillus sp. TaxID=924 RepID=UPI0025EB1084|nr:DUF488 domain-containing protein [Thiobacillus sp.]